MLSAQVDGVSPDESSALATLAAIRAFAASRPTVYLTAHDPDAGVRLAERRFVGRCASQTGREFRSEGSRAPASLGPIRRNSS